MPAGLHQCSKCSPPVSGSQLSVCDSFVVFTHVSPFGPSIAWDSSLAIACVPCSVVS
jgi:hypothetical protein